MRKIYFLGFLGIFPAAISIIVFKLMNYHPIKIDFKYNRKGEIIASSPFPPNSQELFGVDKNSNNMLFVILEGYSNTLLVLLTVSCIVLLISVIIGTLLSLQKSKFNMMDALIDPFYVIPQSILGYIILKPILYEPMEGFKTTEDFRIAYNLIVLVIIMLPTTIALVKHLTDLIKEKEFVTAALTMTPSKHKIFWTHIFINMLPQYSLVFLRILFQTLIIISHLAFFKIYFGGTDVCYGPGCLYNEQPIMNELSSLLGYHFPDFYTSWWTFCFPLAWIIYMLLIIKSIDKQISTRII